MDPPRIIYFPRLTAARFVKAYRFAGAGYCCVLVAGGESDERIQYAHVMYVHPGSMQARAVMAVAAESNALRPGT